MGFLDGSVSSAEDSFPEDGSAVGSSPEDGTLSPGTGGGAEGRVVEVTGPEGSGEITCPGVGCGLKFNSVSGVGNGSDSVPVPGVACGSDSVPVPGVACGSDSVPVPGVACGSDSVPVPGVACGSDSVPVPGVACGSDVVPEGRTVTGSTTFTPLVSTPEGGVASFPQPPNNNVNISIPPKKLRLISN